MNNRPMNENEMPSEIDFSKAILGLHHVPPGAKVCMPVSVERGVWEYFSENAEQRGVGLSVASAALCKRDSVSH